MKRKIEAWQVLHMELLELRFLSHCLSYTFPKGEREDKIRLAGNVWKLSGHPLQYEKQNKHEKLKFQLCSATSNDICVPVKSLQHSGYSREEKSSDAG